MNSGENKQAASKKSPSPAKVAEGKSGAAQTVLTEKKESSVTQREEAAKPDRVFVSRRVWPD